jgi:multidrug efflux pump subunit AcrB
MWIVKLALKYPHFVTVLALLILVLGLISVYLIPADILPVFKSPAVQVMTYYPGMPTSAVEKTISNRVERWTDQAIGCNRVESKSTLGVSVVRLYFRDDIDPNGALTQVNSLALGTLPTLPPNTLPPVVLPFDPTGTLPLGILSVTTPEPTAAAGPPKESLSHSARRDDRETRLKDLARIDVRNMLGGVKGVVAPAVFGGKDRTILIYVDPLKLNKYDLSPNDVVEALRKSNLMATPGVAKFGGYEFQLESNAMVQDPKELDNIPIRFEPGNNVYLYNVGHAEDSSAIQTSLVRINGKQQVYVPIYRQQGASSITVIDGVRNEIPHMEDVLKANGNDVKLEVVMDQSDYVRGAIKSLIQEGVIGAVLVSIMILIFLGNWRMTLIASMSIPLAVLCAITGLFFGGQIFGVQTINAMTLSGLALAIGPLVDDAIVVLENTHRHQTMGKSRIKAAFDGAVEVTLPVLVATLTTIIVLVPIAFMPGMGGFLFRPLTLAVAFAMIASFILSRTFVPGLCAKWLKEHRTTIHGHLSAHGRVDRAMAWVTRRYERVLSFALGHRALILGAAAILFVGSLCLLPFIGREFFPQVDAGQLTIYVRARSGTNIQATEKQIAEVEAFLSEHIPARDRRMIISEIGIVPDWSAAYTPNSGSQDAVIKVQFTEERSRSAQEYAIHLRHLLEADPRPFPKLQFSFDTGGLVSAALNYGASSPIDVQVEGGSREEAVHLASRIAGEIRGVRGAADVRLLQRQDAPQRVIEVDRQQAARNGLTEENVIMQVQIAMNSSVAINRNFWIDPKTGNQYFVAVQYEEDPDQKLEDLLNIPATGTNQPRSSPVMLSSLARLDPREVPVEINHVNLARVYNVLVNTEHRDIGGLASDIQRKLKTIQHAEWESYHKDRDASAKMPKRLEDQGLLFPDGMRVNLRGEYSRMNESFGNLGFGLALATILVYLLLVVLFRSYLGPFIIMFTVPLGLIGVLTMLFVTGTTLNVQSSMGMIFLVGIVVSNGVLLVDFANRQRMAGATVRQAIATAATTRFRPIIMTFLATFLGLLPMAIGWERGSEAVVPLARAVVGGLLTSTFLTLVVVPILYTLFIRDRSAPEIDIDAELADGPRGPGPAFALLPAEGIRGTP